MTLFYGGVCFLLMGLFYYVVDMKGIRFGIGWLKYYGMNSLVAYCLFFVVDFRSISHSLFFGLEQWMGTYYPLIGVCFQVCRSSHGPEEPLSGLTTRRRTRQRFGSAAASSRNSPRSSLKNSSVCRQKRWMRPGEASLQNS